MRRSEPAAPRRLTVSFRAARSRIRPPDHIHMEQEERVELLEGTIRCRAGGEERVLGPGETVTIPCGVYHAVWSSDPAGSRSVGEFRPALKMQEIFEAKFAAD